MADVVNFPERYVRKPRPAPEVVAVQFDMGRWCVSLLTGNRLTERRHYFGTYANTVAQGQRIAAERGLPFRTDIISSEGASHDD